MYLKYGRSTNHLECNIGYKAIYATRLTWIISVIWAYGSLTVLSSNLMQDEHGCHSGCLYSAFFCGIEHWMRHKQKRKQQQKVGAKPIFLYYSIVNIELCEHKYDLAYLWIMNRQKSTPPPPLPPNESKYTQKKNSNTNVFIYTDTHPLHTYNVQRSSHSIQTHFCIIFDIRDIHIHISCEKQLSSHTIPQLWLIRTPYMRVFVYKSNMLIGNIIQFNCSQNKNTLPTHIILFSCMHRHSHVRISYILCTV